MKLRFRNFEPIQHREGDVKTCARCTVKDHYNGYYCMAYCYCWESLTPTIVGLGEEDEGRGVNYQERPIASILLASSHTVRGVEMHVYGDATVRTRGLPAALVEIGRAHV